RCSRLKPPCATSMSSTASDETGAAHAVAVPPGPPVYESRLRGCCDRITTKLPYRHGRHERDHDQASRHAAEADSSKRPERPDVVSRRSSESAWNVRGMMEDVRSSR